MASRRGKTVEGSKPARACGHAPTGQPSQNDGDEEATHVNESTVEGSRSVFSLRAVLVLLATPWRLRFGIVAVRAEASCTAAAISKHVAAPEGHAGQGRPPSERENGRTGYNMRLLDAGKCGRVYTGNRGDGSALHVVTRHEPAKRDSQLWRTEGRRPGEKKTHISRAISGLMRSLKSGISPLVSL